MVSLNNAEIRQTFNYLSTIDNILQKDIKLVRGNKSHLDKLVPENLIREFTLKQSVAFEFIDNLSKTFYESSVVAMVAVFERVIFAKYKTSFGNIKAVVRDKVEKPIDYFLMREKFVDGSADKLHLIIELIKEHIEPALLDRLKVIKEHRDYIAHGKRFGTPPSTEIPLEQIALTLDEIVMEIEK